MKTYQEIVRSVYGENRSSFWSGFAGALDLFGAWKRRTPRRRLRSEADAFTEDWANVSHDLQRAFQRAASR